MQLMCGEDTHTVFPQPPNLMPYQEVHWSGAQGPISTPYILHDHAVREEKAWRPSGPDPFNAHLGPIFDGLYMYLSPECVLI